MYTLTLTAEERAALDWVGGRYSHGYDLYRLLFVKSDVTPDEDWDYPSNLTFAVPEHTAWEIRDIAEECEYRWDCFAPELARKLTDFCMAIV